MDAEKKKPIMLGIVVVCLVVAGAITYFKTAKKADDLSSIKSGVMMWVKCANPNCNAEYQMEKKEYYQSAQGSVAPKCKQCGETTLYDAIKCEKCGIVFIPGALRGEVRDRCPECGFSKIKGDTKSVK